MSDIPELADYARRATAAMVNRRQRREARAELYEHAVTRYEEERAAGADHADAVSACLADLGEPDEFAAELDRANRPRLTPLAVAALVVASLSFFALLWVIAYSAVNG